ncbi:RNA-binding cell elongation regulator Jag/EloR [Spirochaetia bacterium 38H-sp]|uniref:RNA-binding protein KhpB n=1 Tax=Rarispira pelagica TaxID=3141764 RepID=A0ABU9U985_9SPIR
MVQEFEGKTEQDAIKRAIDELGLSRESFDVEIVEEQKPRLFKSGKVVIRVHIPEGVMTGEKKIYSQPENDVEHAVIDFVEKLTEKMGFPAKVFISDRQENKLILVVESEYSNILIGRKGKNLDAIQLLANVIVSRLGAEELKVVIDAENYRSRREEQIVSMARKIANQVKRTRRSVLLEPMNPFERRLIHTALSDIKDVATKSEGEGLIKQVRVYYTGGRRK